MRQGTPNPSDPMGTLKKYRFRLAWQNYRVGAVIEPTGVVRDWLLANGYIEPVADAAPPAPAPEPLGAVEPPAEPAVTPAGAHPMYAPNFVRKKQRA